MMAQTKWIKVVSKGKSGLKRQPNGSRQPTKPASFPSADKQSKNAFAPLQEGKIRFSRGEGGGSPYTVASVMPKEIFQRAFSKALRARASYLGRKLIASELRALSLSVRRQYNPAPPRNKKGRVSKKSRPGLGYTPRPQAGPRPVKQQKSSDDKKKDTYASVTTKAFVRGKTLVPSQGKEFSKGAAMLAKLSKTSIQPVEREVSPSRAAPSAATVTSAISQGAKLLADQAASAARKKLAIERFRLCTSLQRSGIDALEKSLLLAQFQETFPDTLKHFTKCWTNSVEGDDTMRVYMHVDFDRLIPSNLSLSFVDQTPDDRSFSNNRFRYEDPEKILKSYVQ
jgi:hypothetical protein